MNRRVVTWLAVAAVLVTAAAFWLDRNQTVGSRSAQPGKLWPGFDANLNRIGRIRIARGDGSLVNLQRSAAGWQVQERSYAADAGKIRKLLLDLAALEIVEEKTSNAQRYAVLGIDAPTTPTAAGTLIELFLADAPAASPAYALIAGKSAGSREIYARRPADKPGFLVRPSLTADATPARWLDTALLDIKAEQIQLLQATPATGAAWTLSRSAPTDLAMTLDRAAAKTAATQDNNTVTGLLGSFASLTIEDLRAVKVTTAPVTPMAANDLPVPDRLRVQTFDGLLIDFTGVREGDKRWIRLTAASSKDASKDTAQRLRVLATGHEFELPSWKYDAIFRKRDDIAPPTARG